MHTFTIVGKNKGYSVLRQSLHGVLIKHKQNHYAVRQELFAILCSSYCIHTTNEGLVQYSVLLDDHIKYGVSDY